MTKRGAVTPSDARPSPKFARYFENNGCKHALTTVVLVPAWPSSVSVWPAVTSPPEPSACVFVFAAAEKVDCSWLTKKKSSPSPASGAQTLTQAPTTCEVQVGASEPKARVLPPRKVWSKLIVSESTLPKIRVMLRSRPGSSSVEHEVESGPGVIEPWRCITVPKTSGSV